MKKVVCGCFGTIYYAQILKNGLMSDTNREDITDDAISAVTQHIINMNGFSDKKFAGYDFEQKDGSEIALCVYDKSKYKLVPITE